MIHIVPWLVMHIGPICEPFSENMLEWDKCRIFFIGNGRAFAEASENVFFLLLLWHSWFSELVNISTIFRAFVTSYWMSMYYKSEFKYHYSVRYRFCHQIVPCGEFYAEPDQYIRYLKWFQWHHCATLFKLYMLFW